MGEVTTPKPVRLITAICYSDKKNAGDVLQRMVRLYGAVDDRSEEFRFMHTDYYTREMGSSLVKFFASFTVLFDPADLPEIKQQTNLFEDRFAHKGRRTVNIDPGYMEAPKLVLATTKNFAHRIYIGRGIYGDVQLVWKHGRFVTNPWTYPDYRERIVIDFFTRVREKYVREVVNE
jgi:hypothetical protein